MCRPAKEEQRTTQQYELRIEENETHNLQDFRVRKIKTETKGSEQNRAVTSKNIIQKGSSKRNLKNRPNPTTKKNREKQEGQIQHTDKIKEEKKQGRRDKEERKRRQSQPIRSPRVTGSNQKNEIPRGNQGITLTKVEDVHGANSAADLRWEEL